MCGESHCEFESHFFRHKKDDMNNTYDIKVSSPLLRPGMVIRTTCSEKYVVPVVNKMMDMVREINTPKPEKGKKK